MGGGPERVHGGAVRCAGDGRGLSDEDGDGHEAALGGGVGAERRFDHRSLCSEQEKRVSA